MPAGCGEAGFYLRSRRSSAANTASCRPYPVRGGIADKRAQRDDAMTRADANPDDAWREEALQAVCETAVAQPEK
jgi:hypothetical protein